MSKNNLEESSKGLLSNYQLGRFKLSHRIVLAPMTRCRALDHLPQAAHIEFYSQRATKGGFLITEGVGIADNAFGFPHCPGIYTEEQVEAWKPVSKAVHDKGGVIFCQLWHVGRASHTCYQADEMAPVSATGRKISDHWTILMPDASKATFSWPRVLNAKEIELIIEQFRRSARNAIEAGFDGVEIHGAHGYLVDQFLKDSINDRTDEYGGPVHNRCRFLFRIIAAITEEIGGDRVGVRISPLINHLDATDSDPLSLALYIIQQLNNLPAPGLCYLHLTCPRFTAGGDVEDKEEYANYHSCIRKAFRGTLISSGGYSRDSGMAAIVNGEADLVSYGRLFLSNPDLPLRFATAGLHFIPTTLLWGILIIHFSINRIKTYNGSSSYLPKFICPTVVRVWLGK
ncbi:hypothetical protein SUGI_0993090 [Cryptomeria japonica]|uniref:12-oxophytodienoate reductase 3 isoform X2 n=1 Tax=Cryptomeria japonica TaxID=3369 RepID=UPI0024148E9D|nr:12-oxophytodienoate reductase 3 isoform X2 [Cryptomeria japonica]GLJ47035.1 hypothetical protein SUGI_0993090 [Cryptomeria japonica]